MSEIKGRQPDNEKPLAQYMVVEDEIDLRELFGTLWRAKWIIAGVSLLIGLVAAVVTLNMPNVYKSEALLAPAEESSGGGIAAIGGQLGGLASLAGVRLGKGETSKVAIGLEVLKSRSFLVGFIERRDILVPLLAVKEWDAATGQPIFDEKLYDPVSKNWVGQNSESSNAKPSDWKAYKKFSGLLQVSQAKDTGLINISVEHTSPLLAQQWLEWLIADVNAQMRGRDIEEANRSIAYLKQQLEQTPLAGMQQVFYQLIEKQMQTIMLANVRDQYVFKIIDPPAIPEEKVSPKRGMIVMLSVVLAFIFSLAFVLIYNAYKKMDSEAVA